MSDEMKTAPAEMAWDGSRESRNHVLGFIGVVIGLIVAVSHLGTRAWRKQFHQTITNGLRYRAPVIVCPNCGAVDSDE